MQLYFLSAYVAYLLKQYGWGIDRVKKHQDWSGKYCPHRTLDLGWERFLNMVNSYLGGQTPVYNNIKNERWYIIWLQKAQMYLLV